MEIKEYLFLIRKWTWLLILGMVLGGIGGYIASTYQEVIYQTRTKIMVSRALDQDGQNAFFYNEIQLAKSYAQMINTGPILKLLEARLGYPVSAGEITVRQIPNSTLLEITVENGNPQRAAEIANNLTEVFKEYNKDLQAGRFSESETSLQMQINQVETQISNFQDELLRASEQTEEQQKQDQELRRQQRLNELRLQLDKTETEIIDVEREIEAFFPPAVVPTGTYYRTPTPVPTPTLSAGDAVAYKEAQNRLDELTTLRNLYKTTYANLLVFGDENTDQNDTARQEQLQAALSQYQQIYYNLLTSYENVRLAKLQTATSVDTIEEARVPVRPIQPQPLRNVLFGALSGLLITAAIAFAIEFLDDTLKTPEDIERYLKVPVIGLIGEMEKPRGKDKNSLAVYVAENPLSPITEGFRTLRTNLDFAGVDRPLKCLLVTSAGPSEGKSTIASNLAVVMAQGDRKVVLVDTDLRRPSVHRYLQVPNRRGLSDVFRDQATLSSVITYWGTPPIAVITSGGLPPNPTELVSSEKMDKILAELKEHHDFTILDAPPCIVADPIILSAKADGVLLVIEPGKTKIGAAQVVMEQFHRGGARVVGVVLNPVSSRRGRYYSKYHYYTTYYYYSRGYTYAPGVGNGATKNKRNGRSKDKDIQPAAPTLEQ